MKVIGARCWGCAGWPASGEELIVARNILLAELTGTHVHCQHLSSAGSVQLLREARKRGVPISGEACPHHFTLTDTVLAGSDKFWSGRRQGLMPSARGERPRWPSYDTNFKMNPPLRSAADRARVDRRAWPTARWKSSAAITRRIAITKRRSSSITRPFGIIGFETELALSLMQLYHSRGYRLSDLIAKFTIAPARLLRLPGKGNLSVGADGDVTVFDPDQEWVFDLRASASKSRNSPFAGWRMKGKACATIVAGAVVFEEMPAGVGA